MAGSVYTLPGRRSSRRIGLHGLPRIIAYLSSAFSDWRRRARERRTLARMDPRELRDLGITRADVWRETRKPRWRA
jgi:uncharacterized protein YjiS (DUF1127 family)